MRRFILKILEERFLISTHTQVFDVGQCGSYHWNKYIHENARLKKINSGTAKK